MQRSDPPAPTAAKVPKAQSYKPRPAPAAPDLASGAIPVGHPKISIPIPVTRLPLDLFVPEPAPQPDVTLRLIATSGVELNARIAGKTFRRCLKAVVADGPLRDDSFAIVQGRLAPGGRIEEAGLAYAPRPRSDG